jgi:RIP metalloprotease RseP
MTAGAGLYAFAAVVNINLAVVNVLPLPALDGGYLLLLLIEALRRGKKLPEEVEATFMFSGFVLLVSLGVLLIVKDTINILPK